MKANVFIIGAPKCATTSIAAALSKHSKINVSSPKESYFFSKDLAEKGQFIGTSEEYFDKFYSKESMYEHYIDASSQSLHSAVAVDEILAYNPDAKFIVCVRNPVDMIISWHNQMVVSGHEDISNFQDAWNASGQRKKWPKFCTEHKFLNYKEFSRLGKYLVKFKKKVTADNYLVVNIDDLKTDSAIVMERICSFLDIHNEETEILSENTRKKFKAQWHSTLFNGLRYVKHKYSIFSGFNLNKFIDKLFYTEAKKPSLSKEFRREINTYLKNDIEMISNESCL